MRLFEKRQSEQGSQRARFAGEHAASSDGSPTIPWLGVVLVSLLFLSGCGSQEPFAISTELLLGVLASVKNSKGLRFTASEVPRGEPVVPERLLEGRQKAWFVFRRTELMGARHSDWDQAELVTRVLAQFNKIEAFLASKLGPSGSLAGFAESGGSSSATNMEAFTSSPSHHLDLANLAIVLTGGTSEGLQDDYRRDRYVAVRAIVWHAAGHHDEVWSAGGDGDVLNEKALNELLDRRLRTVERMRYQVNGGGYAKENPSGDRRGPWFDGSRVRVFEYPYFETHLVDPNEIGTSPTHIWRTFSSAKVRYVHNGSVTRFDGEPDVPSSTWLKGSDGYFRAPAPTESIASALDQLLKSRLNVWERAWLYCDHSIAALHLEALRFALLRRTPVVDFDALVRPKFPYLAGLIGRVEYTDGKPKAKDTNNLWSDGVTEGAGDTGTFDSLFAKFREAQVGDHVILWNHHLYVSVTNGPWRLENAFITELDPVVDNWNNQRRLNTATFMSPSPRKLRLHGFGAGYPYPRFLEELLGGVKGAFDALIVQAGSEPGPAFIAPDSADFAVVVQWSPYSSGITGTPWFIFLRRLTQGDDESPYPDQATMHSIIRHSVIDGSGRGSDYQSPPASVSIPSVGTLPLTDGVFFPLFIPKVRNRVMTWDTYFERRSDNSSLTATLEPLELKPNLIPGLFVRGKTNPFQVLRPRARP